MKQTEITEKQFEATDIVYKLRSQTQNDNVLAELIGISKVTLYTRLKESNWKKGELMLIINLKKVYNL